MISVVCVYNDLSIYSEYLLSSIQRQKGDHELIAIDNRDGHFKSAAEALNDGGRKANGDFIMFAHQDVRLDSDNWLNGAEEMLRSISDLGIAGVAGREDKSGVISVLIHGNQLAGVISVTTHGDPPEPVGSIHPIEPLRVQTVDECLFFVPRDVFASVWMDEQVCDDWHLYSVEYSLSLRERGLVVYVLPLQVHHKSMGRISETYFTVLAKIVAKHKNHFLTINTTIGVWSTVIPINIQRIYFRLRESISVFMASRQTR